MSRDFEFIKDLKKGITTWKIALRIIDKWIVSSKNGDQHIELIMQDSKGDRIHALTHSNDLNHWKENIIEHQTYTMYNCAVFDNKGPNKRCDHPFKIQLTGGTKLTATDYPDIPQHSFQFKSIGEILKGKMDFGLLYDVIGVLHEIGKTQPGGAGKKACANIVLTDESGNLIDVTLWEDFATKFLKYISDRKQKGPIVIILTHAMYKLADNGNPNLSNAWSGSKLLIDLHHPQVDKFMNGFDQIKKSHVATYDFSQVSSSSHQTSKDSISNMNEVMSIADIKQIHKDTYFNTVGTPTIFNSNKYGWYYEGCSKCNKSSKTKGMSYTCGCGEKVESGTARYKVVIGVEHQNHNSEFVFWDSRCQSMVGMTATELRKTMIAAGEDDPKIYPKDLDKMLHEELAFRVKYQSHYHQCSVLKISKDPIVIQNIKDQIKDENTSKVNDDQHDLDKNSQTPSLIRKGKSDTYDELNTPTQSFSAYGETDHDIITSVTPAKQLSTDVDANLDDQFITPQASSTKFAKHISK